MFIYVYIYIYVFVGGILGTNVPDVIAMCIMYSNDFPNQ